VTREQAREQIRARLNPLWRALFDRLLASTITYIDLRERTSLFMSEDAYRCAALRSRWHTPGDWWLCAATRRRLLPDTDELQGWQRGHWQIVQRAS